MQLRRLADPVNADPETFTGDVYVWRLKEANNPSRLIVALARFDAGARTHWHSHAVGQTLHVTAGVGLVGSRGGDVVRVGPGDTVWAPPGEEHWHGATATGSMSHIAMLEGTEHDHGTTWLERVGEEDYRSANRTGVAPL